MPNIGFFIIDFHSVVNVIYVRLLVTMS